MSVIAFSDVENKIIEIRGQQVIIDSDVAELYGVETREVNQALSRNLEKFPEGYIFELDAQEKEELITNCDHLKKLKFSPSFPKAFTERGLYMLATILKSAKATATTLAIIDTFAQVREVSRIVNTLPTVKQDSVEQNKLMQKAGDIISELVVPDNIESEETEASIELNFAVVKFKYSVKKKSK
ncbi:MAG: ORF6N domain-containing protein [Sphingobacteriaceae bacterium]|nr:ORF6N domain-containing protein [Sphingobacteriaceae bacterium]